jgi:hypothetical protein
MGLINQLFGGAAATTAFGNAARGVAEVFTANKTSEMTLSHEAYLAALGVANSAPASARAAR